MVLSLQKDHPRANVTKETTGWECRAWIPRPFGMDSEGGCLTVVERKIAFKSPTREGALRKAEEARRNGLLLVNVHGPYDSVCVEQVSVDLNEEIKETHRQARREMRRRVTEGHIPTISDLIRRNIKLKEGRGQIEPSTAETDRQNLKRIETQTIPDTDPDLYVPSFVLGDLRIDEVTQTLLQEFVDSLSKARSAKTGEALSPKYIRNIVGTIASGWKILQSDEHLRPLFGRLLFTKGHLNFPKPKEVRPNTKYTAEEVEDLIANCTDDMDRAFLALGLTGMRAPGEPAGCKWSDLHEYGGETFVSVERQIQEVKGRFISKPTKTGARGERSVPIPKRLVEMIEPMKVHADRSGSEFILCGNVGAGSSKGCTSPNVLQERFNRLKERAGITRDGATLYALRHTVISEFRRVHGSDIAQLIGGHTNKAMLDKHYDQNRSEELLTKTAEDMPWAKARG